MTSSHHPTPAARQTPDEPNPQGRGDLRNKPPGTRTPGTPRTPAEPNPQGRGDLRDKPPGPL
ncbi:hypothetical protein ACGFNQ_33840 [Streptomyces asoensis]|uniref:hypothetical protein n=1 Tax=Streptomyces asoensis TaxID=249586 RepID=UPI00372193E3